MADAQTQGFGALLKRLRLAAGLSQEALAERARVSTQAISALERGVRKTPYRDTVALLGEALGLSSSERAQLEAAASRRRGPRSAAEVVPMPLHAPATPLIGRDADVAELIGAFKNETRLLTLTGTGGIGKTRLAYACADALRADFPEGVSMVSLAPIRDPELVAPAIAATIGLRIGAGQLAEDAMLEFLADLRHLLVLDNFEQVLGASQLVARILARCTGVAVLVTSRAPLHLPGEQEYAVPALAMPDAHIEAGDLSKYAGPRLFIERALAINPRFAPQRADADAIAQICKRLDGLPLAIELAAPLTRFFSPSALLKRLDKRLDLLVMGPRETPRHQTMRNAIDWTYSLLEEDDRRLFRRLSVFVGGWSVEAAQSVCMDDEEPSHVFERLATLLDWNLLQQSEYAGEIRIGMLETVSEFGLEKLDQSGELERMRTRHAHYFRDLSREAQDGLSSADQADWYARLDLEIGNLRSALGFARAREEPSLGLALATHLQRYWEQRGLMTEGRNWLELFLAMSGAQALEEGPLVLDALMSAGVLADRQDDYIRARQLIERASEGALASGDKLRQARSLSWLGVIAQARGEYERASAYHAESVAVARSVGDAGALALILNNYGLTVRDRGDLDTALELFTEALALARAGNVPLRIALIASNFAVLERRRGDLTAAAKLLEESARLRQEVGDRWGMVVVLVQLGDVALERGEVERAESYYRESMRQNRSVGLRELYAMALEGLARVAFARGEQRLGVLEAAAAARERLAIGVPNPEHANLDAALSEAHARMGERGYAQAWSEGSVLSLHDVVARVLELHSSAT